MQVETALKILGLTSDFVESDLRKMADASLKKIADLRESDPTEFQRRCNELEIARETLLAHADSAPLAKSNSRSSNLIAVAVVVIIFILLYPSLRDNLKRYQVAGIGKDFVLFSLIFPVDLVNEMSPSERERIRQESVGRNAGEIQVFDGIEFVWIPSGTFKMGAILSPSQVVDGLAATEELLEGLREEHPQHRVTISTGYWLGKYEITHRQFKQFVDETGYLTDVEQRSTSTGYDTNYDFFETQFDQTWRSPGPGMPTGNDFPACHLSWNDSYAYTRWLTKKGNGTYRLPSEAEWEYACRADTTTVYPWGDAAEAGEGNFNGRDQASPPELDAWVAGFEWNDNYWSTAPVGSYRPNPWGVYDMIGNVSEWCSDWRHPYKSADATDPLGPATSRGGDLKMIRGGAWMHTGILLRPACRFQAHQKAGSAILGFRVVRNP